ncbi:MULTISPECIES: class I SAM-dependent methyltransferase [unclassified Bradyrhizobium]|uniref:class I SAM-dependent methyltransferase n=1 Tax=unclassified Bradyrhizobium TaxID=2631580 RepID=UPI0028E62FD2|nr:MULTISPECIES: class I SAM-dependent methyltransferase [unclassified Bradyrhizobium]
MKKWNFENTKDTPLGRVTEEAAARFETLGYSPADFYEQWPCFLGAKQIGRFMSMHDCYMRTLGLAGHMAEVGVYRGGMTMFLAKLSLLYEPHATTQVHGFDLFDMDLPRIDDGPQYIEPYERIREMIEVQGLQRYAILHQMNVVTKLRDFFTEYPHLQFKLVFLDAGVYDVVTTCIREFWPRLSNRGIMVFDQYNHEAAPEETRAIRDSLPAEAIIRSFPNGWMPTAYVVKGERA